MTSQLQNQNDNRSNLPTYGPTVQHFVRNPQRPS